MATITTTNISTAYFEESEFIKKIGQERKNWALALLKEMVDNALDNADEARIVAPQITVDIKKTKLTVKDNGSGMSPDLVEGILDFKAYVSTKRFTKSLSRGQIGNAFKVLLASGYVATGKPTKLEIVSQGVRHTISVDFNKYTQEPIVKHKPSGAEETVGTEITLEWQNADEELSEAPYLLNSFRALNPHATFNDGLHNVMQKGSFGVGSPHWYSAEEMHSLIAAYVRSDKLMKLETFLSKFYGLSSAVSTKLALQYGSLLSNLIASRNETKDLQLISKLLLSMREAAKPVKPAQLGLIGMNENTLFLTAGSSLTENNKPCPPVRGEYVGPEGQLVPYVIEAAAGTTGEGGGGNVFGINNSPSLTPMLAWQNLLHNVDDKRLFDKISLPHTKKNSTALAVHIYSPVSFANFAKSTFEMPREMKESLVKVLRKVLVQTRARSTKYEMTKKAAALLVMEDAYNKASDNGSLPASQRQLYYAARERIKELSGYANVDQKEFNNWVDEFLDDPKNSELTAEWDIVKDARGHFTEPHTGHSFGLGTIAVREYIERGEENSDLVMFSRMFPTNDPTNRFRAALFIEKEGFDYLIERSKIAEKFDLAVFSTKGFSVIASRKLIDYLAGKGVKILIAHDYDISGLGIRDTLTTSTKKYKFKNPVEAVDIGLTLEDITKMGLETETVSGKTAPPAYLLPEDRAYLVESEIENDGSETENDGKVVWTGKRVELNAMTSPRFIEWLTSKLEENGVRKVVPNDETLAKAWARAQKMKKITEYVEQLEQEQMTAPPANLYGRVAQKLEENPELSWDEAVRRIVEGPEVLADPRP